MLDAFLMLMVVLGVLLSVSGIVMWHRYRIRIQVIETYNLQYISDVLPTLLSSTSNGRRVSELLGEYLALGSETADEDVKTVPTTIKTKLDLLLSQNQCYRLYTDNFEVKSDSWDSSACQQRETQVTSARITLPYSQNSIKQIILLSKSPYVSITGG